MAEKAKAPAKTSAGKIESHESQPQITASPQAINSPAGHVMFMQQAGGNRAAEGLVNHLQQLQAGEQNQPPEAKPEEEMAAGSPTSAELPSAAPKSLSAKGASHQVDPTFAYISYIAYEVLDDKGSPIKGFDVNEQWTTGVVNDAAKADWRRGNPGGYTSTTTSFSDHIQGESAGHTPAPQNPQKPLGSTKVQHWGQDWYIGSTTPGKGTKVQSNTFQKYQDHATHTNIKSPP